MTDYEVAIERLTAWVRDYGDKKPKEFVGDISLLLCAAKDVQKLSSGVVNWGMVADAEHALVEKLQATIRRMRRIEWCRSRVWTTDDRYRTEWDAETERICRGELLPGQFDPQRAVQ